jgi:hypothetical protein
METMRYVARNGTGQVVAVSLVQDAAHPEALPPDHPELKALVPSPPGEEGPLAESDLRLVRVLEDLIDLLIDKEVIRFTDLPAPAQEQLMERRSLRHGLRGLRLIDDGEVL